MMPDTRVASTAESYLTYSPHTLWRVFDPERPGPVCRLCRAVLPPRAFDRLARAARWLGSWFFTLDHKRIGVLYMVGILASFLLGGIFALIVRLELAEPGPTILGSNPTLARNLYNQMFTLHGAVMIFLFILPGTPAILGNFMLPLMLGAKDVA